MFDRRPPPPRYRGGVAAAPPSPADPESEQRMAALVESEREAEAALAAVRRRADENNSALEASVTRYLVSGSSLGRGAAADSPSKDGGSGGSGLRLRAGGRPPLPPLSPSPTAMAVAPSDDASPLAAPSPSAMMRPPQPRRRLSGGGTASSSGGDGDSLARLLSLSPQPGMAANVAGGRSPSHHQRFLAPLESAPTAPSPGSGTATTTPNATAVFLSRAQLLRSGVGEAAPLSSFGASPSLVRASPGEGGSFRAPLSPIAMSGLHHPAAAAAAADTSSSAAVAFAPGTDSPTVGGLARRTASLHGFPVSSGALFDSGSGLGSKGAFPSPAPPRQLAPVSVAPASSHAVAAAAADSAASHWQQHSATVALLRGHPSLLTTDDAERVARAINVAGA